MVAELSEQPTSSLPLVNQVNVSKVQASEETPGPYQGASCFIASTSDSSVSESRRWADSVSRIVDRTGELGQYVKQIIAYLAAKFREFFNPAGYFVYEEPPLSPESRNQLEIVPRKTLVLDLDETLVHSCYLDPDTNDVVGCNFVPETAVPDYVMHIPILANFHPIEFQVFKRPYVDEFLNFVGRWYDLVIYTASLEAYASNVIDRLDAGRGILQRRLYRQHCISTTVVTKNLYAVNPDLTSTFIIDNSPSAYRDFPENAIPIKSYIYDPNDQELLNLLPFLDALRFTKDVRSILSRRGIAA
ncbi:CTD nuclear envelope phosphatase 1 [Drosophila novamexicana]|uniref:CTD nuclear envelope phosphatase 1 n=1 Tax=Drosophila novamexicana TaxID=47314 RepID=UPI0011E5C400|nr:CTD nuclear envelope phosphatase 1 [Drosophila novamexicana]